ncbi:MAG: OmpH family outer membrane protein [Ignavibacteria bacterium]
MRFKFFFIIFFLSSAPYLFAQSKIGYVDSKLIVESLEDAKDAQRNLDNLVSQWKSELQQLNDSLSFIKNDYEKKKLILTEKVRQQKEEEIKNLEKRISDFKVAKFGENGEYFHKQNEFMKPVQDKIFKALQDVAREGNYDYVFDRSSEILLLYVNEKYDLTQKVIKRLEGK